MALEYVVAGRRPLPGLFRFGVWSWTFSLEYAADDDDEPAFEEGSCVIDEVRPRGNAQYYASVAKHVGFTPKSVLTIRKAGWEFSRAAAEVLAAALDGMIFVDGHPQDVQSVEKAAPARSIEELQARILIASREPAVFFERWAAEDRALRAKPSF